MSKRNMSGDWMGGKGVQERLRCGPGFVKALCSPKLRVSKAVENILGKRIRLKACKEEKCGHLFWGEHIREIKESIKTYEPFTDSKVMWFPYPSVESTFPRICRLLEKWHRRDRCLWSPNKKPPQRIDVLVRASRNMGLSVRYFWRKEDLEDIYSRSTGESDLGRKASGDAKMTTHDVLEDKDLKGYRRWRLYALRKSQKDKKTGKTKPSKIPQDKDVRLDKLGRPQEMALFTKRKLLEQKALRKPGAEEKNRRKLILPSKAAAGNFTRSVMNKLEDAGILTPVYENLLCAQTKKVGPKKEEIVVEYFRPKVKHYYKDEVDEAKKDHAAQKQSRKSDAGIATLAGNSIMTDAASYREYGLGNKLLERAREKGWLEAIRLLKRPGYGRYDSGWWNYEDGEHSLRNLKSLPRGSKKEILWPANKLALPPETVIANAAPRAWQAPAKSNGQAPMNGQADPPIDLKPKPRGRGRKNYSSNPDEDSRIAEAWATGMYITYEDLGRVKGTSADGIKKALDRHRKRRI